MTARQFAAQRQGPGLLRCLRKNKTVRGGWVKGSYSPFISFISCSSAWIGLDGNSDAFFIPNTALATIKRRSVGTAIKAKITATVTI